VQGLRSLILPAASLAALDAATYARILRSQTEQNLEADFMTLARTKGLRPPYLVFRHLLRPSSLPLLTVLGLNLGAMLGGAVVIESLFALPGLGRLTLDAIAGRDLIMVQGIVLFITVAYVLINLVVDIIYGVVDPPDQEGRSHRWLSPRPPPSSRTDVRRGRTADRPRASGSSSPAVGFCWSPSWRSSRRGSASRIPWLRRPWRSGPLRTSSTGSGPTA
jgi:hypothetical protein